MVNICSNYSCIIVSDKIFLSNIMYKRGNCYGNYT
nr:MAG TPA: hypothetical protein [Caudoviricetes sp.]